MSSYRSIFRFLRDPEYDPDYDTELIVFGGDDDLSPSALDDDDEYLLEPWGWAIVMVVGAVMMAGCIMYCSYKHELCARRDRFGTKEEFAGTADLEKGKKIATKTFNDSTAFDRLPQKEVDQHMPSSRGLAYEVQATRTSSSGSSSTQSSNTTTPTKSNFHALVAAPRCVLCSKPYQLGENVTHTQACHHEYHEACLVKFWNTSKPNNGKCPVCKVEYVVAECSPSKHFSSSMHMTASGRIGPSPRELEPFEA